METPRFNIHLGTELVSREDGTAVVALELAEHHLNRRGVAHGGVITSMLDSALGAAVISAIPAEWWCATTSLSTQFLDGAGRGRLTATGRVLRRGRSVAFAEGEVRDARDRLIAKATGTWHLWPFKPDRPRSATGGPYVLARTGSEPLRVGKILAVGRNYADHKSEMGVPESDPPVLFFKPPTALLHDGGEVRIPSSVGRVDHEVELVVVIGRSGRAIAPEQALDHVRGYAVGLDLTFRDMQSQAKQRGEPWSIAKGFDGAAPVSRFVNRDDVGDGSGLAIELSVNGDVRQSGNTSEMIQSVAQLVCLASRWITLERGDLLFTGTPAGVGPVQPGDRLQATLERVGSLTVTVAASDS